MAEKTDCAVPAERIRYLFDYDPLEGILTCRVNEGRRIKGHVMAGDNVTVDGETHGKALFIWLHYYGVWPTKLIDHINRNRKDNRLSNLREVTHTQNQYNKVSPSSCGYKGVTWRDRKRNPWLAKIRIDGVRFNLGSFPTAEAAGKAYEEACLKYHGEFAQLGTK